MVTHQIRYLRLLGRLYADNRVVLLPCFLADTPPRQPVEGDGPVAAELYDRDGTLLLRHRLALGRFASQGDDDPGALFLQGRVPFPATTRLIRLTRDGVVLHELPVGEHAPTLRLTWEPAEHVRGVQQITWEGAHAEGRPLQYVLRYRHDDGEAWQRASWRTRETAESLDFDQLPGGDRCRLAVVATDGVNTATVESRPFRVSVKPCQALLLEPADGSRQPSGQPIWLRGQGYYLEERRPETEALSWHSSRDGELGQGLLLQVSGLTPGEHRLTLTAGLGERAGRAEVTVVVEQPNAAATPAGLSRPPG